jgi:hypothetical protein
VPRRKHPDSPYWRAVDAAVESTERSLIASAFQHFPKLETAAEFLGVSVPFLSKRCIQLQIALPSVLARAGFFVNGEPSTEGEGE